MILLLNRIFPIVSNGNRAFWHQTWNWLFFSIRRSHFLSLIFSHWYSTDDAFHIKTYDQNNEKTLVKLIIRLIFIRECVPHFISIDWRQHALSTILNRLPNNIWDFYVVRIRKESQRPSSAIFKVDVSVFDFDFDFLLPKFSAIKIKGQFVFGIDRFDKSVRRQCKWPRELV